METRKCKKCGLEKDIQDYYYSSTNYRRLSCKSCYNDTQKLYKNKLSIPLSSKDELVLGPRTTPQDYEYMYKLMEVIGFDISKDIAKQFVEKWEKEGVHLTYKPRQVKDTNLHYYDGSLNTKRVRRKNPPDL